MTEPQYQMTVDKEELKETNYFHVCKTNGELIASIGLREGEFIEREGYVVVVDHDEDPMIENRDGVMFIDLESEGCYEI